MTEAVERLTDAASLQTAIKRGAALIEVEGLIVDLPTLNLRANTVLSGVGAGAELRFKEGLPGLMLSANHEVARLRIVTERPRLPWVWLTTLTTWEDSR